MKLAILAIATTVALAAVTLGPAVEAADIARDTRQALDTAITSTDTALTPKVKSLISIAVSAQAPCRPCVVEGKRAALAAGATELEIEEAVIQSGLTRQWGTIVIGLEPPMKPREDDVVWRHRSSPQRLIRARSRYN